MLFRTQSAVPLKGWEYCRVCVCVCIHADVQVCKYMCVFGDVWLALTHSRLVIYTAT